MAKPSVSYTVQGVQTCHPFHFQNHPVRTCFIDETLWLVAKDICTALEIDWSGKTLTSIPNTWQSMGKLPTLRRGEQSVRVISEPAVYKLAFRSNKPQADEFTNWVASEVLPAIRKTGAYNMRPTHPTPLPSKTYTLPAEPYQRFSTAQMQALRSAHKAWAEEVTYNNRFKSAHSTWLILKGHFGGVTRLTDLPSDWFLDIIEFCHAQQEKELERRRARRALPTPAPALPPVSVPRPNYDVPWGNVPKTVSDAARQAADLALPLYSARHTAVALASLIEQARETLDALRVLSALEVK